MVVLDEIKKIRDGLVACPWWVKAIIALGVVYLVSPIDLIPDFIPVLGQLDDIVLVVALAKLVRKYAGTTAL